MTAISVNRLPALFLGLRYKQVVITESTSIILAAVWALPGVSALCYISDYHITVSSNLTLFQLNFESVSLMLED